MRALLRSNRSDDALARALARAGLYVERLLPEEAPQRLAELSSTELAVVDPRLLESPTLPKKNARHGPRHSVEGLLHERLSLLMDHLDGDAFPNLHATVMAQAERALMRVVLARHENLAEAASVLGIHRNTLSRRLEQLGLRTIRRKGS